MEFWKQSEVKEPTIASPIGGLRKRVLVVEDDKTHRSFMNKILEDCQCSVTLAENGVVALSRLDSGEIFDLIIMDWDMPELNGLDTVKAIRSRQANKKIPYVAVIAFTAMQQPGDRERCLAAGMDGYLPKDIWMPRWRQSLINILEGLVSGNFDMQDMDEPDDDNIVNSFDPVALEESASLLKNDFGIAVEEYLADAESYISRIREGFSEGDFRKIESNSHTLKSNSKAFGLLAVSRVAETINSLTRDSVKTRERVRVLTPLVAQLEEAFKQTVPLLKQAVANRGQP